MVDEIVLASLSPFRAQLLKNAGLAVRVEGARFDERAVDRQNSGLSAIKLAQKLALEKARDVSQRFPRALVIGCDQVLELDGKVLHKITGMDEAHRRLQALSGKTHYLHSAIALTQGGRPVWDDAATAAMTVRPLDSGFISRHLARAGEKVLASVGAYQLEGEGVQLFEKINGDYFTIIGLPLLPLLAQLRAMGVIDG
ncbi:Maf-like protein BQ00020 [Harpegnathos saltator]|uniref:Maf-like protein BQ00020 n=1 Tax=Harpegnathos saltator TaxID=610380 RepID=E2B9L7_HARSA|nr:Maf-like protein BQ00020 [Harpegnathos saltator]